MGVKILDPGRIHRFRQRRPFPEKDVGVAVVTTVGLRPSSVTTATFHSDPD
jgi:hypothetical protein